MPHVLGEHKGEKPHPGTGCESWQKLKAVVFDLVLHHDMRTPDMLAFHQSDARINVITAPARGGKSFDAARDAVPYAFPTEGGADSMIWSIGPTYSTNKEFDYLHDIFVEKRERFWAMGWRYEIERERNAPKSGDMEVRIVKNPGGRPIQRAYIRGYSATNQETLQGEEVTWAAMSEAAEHDEIIYRKYLEQRCMRLVMPTTPKQKAAWLKDLIATADPSHGIGIFEFKHYQYQDAHGRPLYWQDGVGSGFTTQPADEAGKARYPARYCPNPNYPYDRFHQAEAAALQRMRAIKGPSATAADDPYFAEQFLGLWSFYEGRVLPFDRSRHVIPFESFDYSNCSIAVSVDYGYEDPASVGIWAIHPAGLYVRLDEIYRKHLETHDLVKATQEKLRELGVTAAYCTGDPSRPEVSRVFHEAGLHVNVRDKNAQRARDAGTRRLVDLLVQGPFPGFPGLFLTDRCTNTASEFERLHYKENRGDEYSATSIVGDDHAFDDTRYFLMTRPRVVVEPQKQRDWMREALWQHSPQAHRFYWPEAGL